MGEYGLENSMCQALRWATAWNIEGLKETRVAGTQKRRANVSKNETGGGGRSCLI